MSTSVNLSKYTSSNHSRRSSTSANDDRGIENVGSNLACQAENFVSVTTPPLYQPCSTSSIRTRAQLSTSRPNQAVRHRSWQSVSFECCMCCNVTCPISPRTTHYASIKAFNDSPPPFEPYPWNSLITQHLFDRLHSTGHIACRVAERGKRTRRSRFSVQ